jgi:uncharacterized protein (DUF2236 family)
MLWTLAVIADSGRALYETLVRRLTDDELEELWQDYVRFGELYGLPRSEVPATHREFEAWWEERLASPDLQPTEHALELAPLLAFSQPVPTAARLNLAAQNHIIKGTLPRGVRETFGIRWSPAHRATFQVMAASHRRARRLFPRPLRRGRNDMFFEVVSRAERERGGTPVPELRPGAS